MVDQVTYSATVGAGKEAGITIAYEGLKLGVYGAERERTVPQVQQQLQVTTRLMRVQRCMVR